LSSERNCRSCSVLRRANPTATYIIRMVTATANTMTDPSLARIEGRRSRGRIAISAPPPECSRLLPILVECVPDPVDGPDVPGLRRLVAELPPDPGDMGIHHAPTCVVAVPPHPVHQLVPAEHDTGIARQRQQDLELER